jgi:hypothetical protein
MRFFQVKFSTASMNTPSLNLALRRRDLSKIREGRFRRFRKSRRSCGRIQARPMLTSMTERTGSTGSSVLELCKFCSRVENRALVYWATNRLDRSAHNGRGANLSVSVVTMPRTCRALARSALNSQSALHLGLALGAVAALGFLF